MTDSTPLEHTEQLMSSVILHLAMIFWVGILTYPAHEKLGLGREIETPKFSPPISVFGGRGRTRHGRGGQSHSIIALY